MDRFSFEVVIIGAGVIGLAIARHLSESGISVLVVEKEERSGEGASSRNSGVIHAGIYYPTSSLKASFCVSGNKQLYEYCIKKSISHKRLGKLIIASDDQEHEKLLNIYKQGLTNGVDLKLLKKDKVQELESDIKCYSAIFSPNTGIIDAPEFLDALEGDIQHNGGLVSYNSEFLSAAKKGGYFRIRLNAGDIFDIESKILINCGGLHSDHISSSIRGLRSKFIKKIYYGKGHYFKYLGKNPFKKLIYPLPKPGSLGIHASMDISGQLRFGPDLEWVDSINYAFDYSLKKKFINSIKLYWPDIDDGKLQPDYCGIRPKIYNEGEDAPDFYISSPGQHGIEGLYNLQGIESPGLTSSLSISEYLLDLIKRNI